jgi:predicted metal-binding membrane protein
MPSFFTPSFNPKAMLATALTTLGTASALTDESSSSSGLSGGAIAGIVVGCCAFVACCACCIQRCRSFTRETEQDDYGALVAVAVCTPGLCQGG